MISLNVFCQTKNEQRDLLINFINQKTKKEVTFISFFVFSKDSIQINQISYFNNETKKFVNLNKNQIDVLWPNLLKGFAGSPTRPTSNTTRGHIE